MLRTIACLCVIAAPVAAVQQIPPDVLMGRITADPAAIAVHDSRDAELADFDLDGDLDLIVVNIDQDNELFWNQGGRQGGTLGTFLAETTSRLVHDGGNSRGLALGDIDLDGDIDVFVCNSQMEVNFLYRNLTVDGGGPGGSSDGEFMRVGPADVDMDAVVTDLANSRHACFFDVDGDRDLDLFVANFNDQDNFLYLNWTREGGGPGGTSDGEFRKVTTGDVVTDGGTSFQCTVGDIDADLDLDLFVTNHDGSGVGPGQVNFLYRNDGGTLVRVTTGPVATDVRNSLACTFFDWDGDRDLDLFVGNNEGEPNQLYVNRGDGNFTVGYHIELTVDRGETIDAVSHDLDGDHDRDLFVINRNDQPNLPYLNLGRGDWVRQKIGPFWTDHRKSYAIALGDLDGDAADDMVIANLQAANDIYTNEGRQWELLGSPLPGTGGLAPRLGSRGNLVAGTQVWFDLTDALPNATCLTVIGVTANPVPLGGITFYPSVDHVFIRTTNGLGEATLRLLIPPGIPFLEDYFVQTLIIDPGSVVGQSATNALKVRAP